MAYTNIVTDWTSYSISNFSTAVSGTNFDVTKDVAANADLVKDASNVAMYSRFDTSTANKYLLLRAAVNSSFGQKLIINFDVDTGSGLDGIVDFAIVADLGVLPTKYTSGTPVSGGIYVAGVKSTSPGTNPNSTDFYLSQTSSSDMLIGDSAVALTSINTDTYVDIIINFSNMYTLLQDAAPATGTGSDGDAQVVKSPTPFANLNENTPIRFALTSSANLNNVNQDISGSSTNDGTLSWSTYLSSTASFANLVASGKPSITSVLENANGGINAAEASDGTPVVVDLTGTGAVAGNTLTINWGSQVYNYQLTAADITANKATVTVPQGTIAAQQGNINVTAHIGTGTASTAFAVTVDTFVPTISSAVVNGNTLTLTYNESLNGTIPAASNYTVDWGGNSVNPTNVAVNGQIVTLTLPTAVTNGSTVTLASPSGTVNDLAGNPISAVSNYSVSNTTPALNTPPSTPTINPITADNVINAQEASNAVLSGTTDSGSTVSLLIGGQTVNATVNGTTWSYTLTSTDLAALGQGSKTVTVTATNGNGSTSTSPQAFTIDTVAPNAPAISTIADDVIPIIGTVVNNGSTNAPALQLSGAAEAGSTISIYNGTTLLGTAVATGGNWSYNATGLTDGTTYNFKATATDAAGNISSDSSVYTVTVDTTAPTLSIGTIATDGIINSTEAGQALTITGTATGADGQTVSVKLGGQTYLGKITNGTWSVSVPQADVATLTSGSVTADVSDAAGNPATQATGSFTVDKTPPTLSIGSIATDGIINSTEAGQALTITGTATGADGLTASIGLGGKTYQATITNGTWSVSVPQADVATLTSGSVTADVSDTAGNTATQATGSFTVDKTPPTLSIGSIATDGIINSTEAGQALTITGTATGADGQTVSVKLGDQTYLGTITSGAWSVSVPQADVATLGSGSVTADVSDAAGNTATQATSSFTVDTTAPTLSIDSIATDNVINNGEATAGVTITGTTEAGSTVQLTIGGQTQSANVNGTSWSYNLTNADLTTLGQGSGKTITATATDAAGNSSNPAPATFAVDTIAPTFTSATIVGNTLTLTYNETFNSSSNPNLSAYTVQIGGTNTTINSAQINGSSVVLTLANAVLSTDNVTVSYAVPGTNPLEDVVGNDVVALSNQNVTNNTAGIPAPTAPTIANPIATNNLIDGTEATAGVILTGSTEAGSTVQLTIGGQAQNAIVNGTTWSYTLTDTDITNLGQGSNKTITATATNTGGTSQAATSLAFEIDTIAPTPLTIDNIATNNVIDGTEVTAGVILTGTTEADSTVQLTIGGQAQNAIVSGTTWSYTLTTADLTNLGQGTGKTIDVTATDAAGNTTSKTSQNFSIDTTAPSAPTIGIIATDDIINSSEASAGVVLTGTTEAGSTVSLNVAGQTQNAIVNGTTWSYTLTTSDLTNLGQGSGKTIDVTATDTAGNTTSKTSQNFSIDTTAPSAPTIGIIATDDIINSNEASAGVVLTGTTEAGSTVSLNVAGQLQNAIVNGTTWSYALTNTDLTNLGQGSGKTIGVTATDAAGNTASKTSQPFAIDTSAPTTPTIGIIATDDIINNSEASAGVVLTGTTETGSSVSLTIGGQTQNATVSGTTWSYTLTTADLTNLGQGSGKTIDVTATDTAGNTTAKTSQPFAIDTTAPSAPTIGVIATDDIINSNEASAGVVLTGTTEAGSSVSLAIGGQAQNAIVSGTTWSYTLTTNDLTNLGQGTGKTIDVTATDAAGNTTAKTSQPFAIDTSAPTFTSATIVGNTLTLAYNELLNASSSPDKSAYSVKVAGVDATINTVTLNGSTVVLTLANAVLSTDNVTLSYAVPATTPVEDAAGNDVVLLSNQAVSNNTNGIPAPAAPTIASPIATDNVINSSEATSGVVLSGTTEANTTVQLTVGGQVRKATVTGTTWSYQLTTADITALGQGSNQTITASATNSGGTSPTATSTAFAIDTIAPTLSIDSIAQDNIINSSEAGQALTITGTATGADGLAASIGLGGQTYQAIITNGKWSVSVPQADVASLPSGSVTADVSDAAGNTATQATGSFTVDTTAPSAPTIGVIATDDIINSSEASAGVVLTGTTETGSSVSLTIGGQAQNAIVSGTTWSYTLTTNDLTNLGQGSSKTIDVTATDAAGNNAAKTSQPFAIDTTAPSALTIGIIAIDDIINSSEASAGVVLTGTTETGSSVSLTIGGQTQNATVSGTTWSYTLTTADLTNLGQGSGKTIGITATDAAGNTTAKTSQPFAIDTSAPSAPTITSIPEAASRLNAVEAADGTIVNVNLAGTGALAGDTLTLNWGTQAVTYVLTNSDITGNSAAVTVAANTIAIQGDGNVSVTAKLADQAGNVGSPAAAVPAVVDTAAPTLSGATINGKTLTLTYSEPLNGNSKPSTGAYTVNVGGSAVAVSAISSNTSTVTLTLASSVNPGDTVTLTYAKPNSTPLQDVAGNDAGSFSNRAVTNSTGDTTAPTISSLTSSLLTLSDTHVGNGTFNLTVVYSEAMKTSINPAFSFPTVSEDPDSAISFTSGSWTNATTYVAAYNVVDTNIDLANVDVRVAGAQDSAGNSQASADFTDVFNIDMTNPTVSLSSQAPSTVNGSFTAIATFSEAVTGFTSSDISINNGSITTAPTSTDGGITYSFTVSPTANGLVIVDVDANVVQDAVGNGNSAASSGIAFTFANTPPTPPTPPQPSPTPALSLGSDTGTSDADNITSDSTPTIAGTADANSTITLYSGNLLLGTTTTNALGKWNFTPQMSLADGTYQITTTVTDAAGNTSLPSSPIAITVDTTPPNGTIDVSAAPTEDTPQGSLAIRFKEPIKNLDLSDLILTQDGTPISLAGAKLTSTDGITWTLSNLSESATEEGDYQLSFTSTNDVSDLAGNRLNSLPQGNWTVEGCQLGEATADISFNLGTRGIRQRGNGGKNRLNGSSRNDILRGLKGNDMLRGKGGSDRLNGGSGKDRLNGGGSNDKLLGKQGNDRLKGASGRDWLDGGSGNDQLNGGTGDDILGGGLGQDTLTGGQGQDMFVFTSLTGGVDHITDFNPTTDVLDLRSILSRPEFAAANIEKRHHQFIQMVQVGANTEVRIDSDGTNPGKNYTTIVVLDNVKIGTFDCNNLVLTGHACQLGTATPRIQFSLGRQGVRSVGKPGNDRVVGTSGNDRLRGASGNDILKGKAGRDRLYGNDGNDVLSSGSDRDRLNGGTGNDWLLGKSGDDILIGGTGQDMVSGGRGRDMFVFQTVSPEGDVITDFNAKKDMLDLRSIFAQPAFAGGKAHAIHSKLIKSVQSGSDAQIQIDADGTGAGKTFVTLVTLKNVAAASIDCPNFIL
jgi:Ca2+-binding RTX toxin-like protein